MRNAGVSAANAIIFLGVCGLLGTRLGTVFLPQLEEGNIWIESGA